MALPASFMPNDNRHLKDNVLDSYLGKLGSSFRKQTLRRVNWICEQVRGKSALDVGCGQGIVPILLAREGQAVTGIERLESSISEARDFLSGEHSNTQERVSLVCADFGTYDFGERRFDTIILREILEHLVHPEVFVQKATKLLNPRGRLILTVPFGIHDSPDHKRTYYAAEPLRLASKHLALRGFSFIDQWFGLVADNSDEPSPYSLEFVESELLSKLEKAFLEIETRAERNADSLRERIAELESNERALREQMASWKAESLSTAQRLTQSADRLARLQMDLQATKHQKQIQDRVEAELDAAQNRYEALLKREQAVRRLEADKVRQTLSFQLGHLLIHNPRSVEGVLRLPSNLLGLRAEAAKRRSAPKKDTSPSATSSTPSVTEAAPRASSPAFKIPTAIAKGARTNLRVACIVDEFTHSSFASEWNLLRVSYSAWREELTAFKPDLLFIESAWHGNNSEWSAKVSSFDEGLHQMIAWCRKRKIPTAFWSKEDPVHFSTFMRVAKAVDFVFTTDIDCIPEYISEVDHRRVFPLLFACQPRESNPIETYRREKAFCFAGSYYAKYTERQHDFQEMVSAVTQIGSLDIYDRNHKGNNASYRFPPEYHHMIRGSLPFSKIDYAYKGYGHGLTINTVKQSQSMFARRAFELVASNTITLSNYSRGLRNTFGDLIPSSDEMSELKTRALPSFSDEPTRNRHRLQALRMVLSRHTYRHRCDEIAEAIWGAPPEASFPSVAVVARANNEVEFDNIRAAVERQGESVSTALVVLDYRASSVPGSHIQTLTAEEAATISLGNAVRGAKLIVPFSASDYYGPHYVEDLALATTYTDLGAITKAAHFHQDATGVQLVGGGEQYRPYRDALLRASLFTREALPVETLSDFVARIDSLEALTIPGISIDEFSYCRNGHTITDEQKATVDVRSTPRTTGLSQADWKAASVAFQQAPPANEIAGLSHSRTMKADELNALLRPDLAANVTWQLRGGNLLIDANLPEGAHETIFADAVFSREDLRFDRASRACVSGQAETLLVFSLFTFFDETGLQVGQAMNRVGSPVDIPVPPEATRITFGLRVQGSGTASIQRCIFGRVHRTPALLLARSRTLMLTKQYPSYEDLYKYGFVHRRVVEYERNGHSLDVVTPRPSGAVEHREFQGTDITISNLQTLDRTLASGQYDQLLVHVLDEKQWDVISKHIAKVPTLVWIHGAEAQPWELRLSDLIGLSEQEIDRKKDLSDRRMRFWNALFNDVPENLKFVFVSEIFAREVMQSVGVSLNSSQYHVIPNVIDTELFKYQPKPPEQRTRILSIRSFASRKYANDLTVSAILELAKRPYFSELEFRIIGDGELFEETVAPLHAMSNVKIDRGFMTQEAIAGLFESYGVLLSPTRMDSQGVSRGEAMASGLVPITTNVAAVPEFVDEESGFLAPPEDYRGLVDAIDKLYHNPDLFLRLSAQTAARVRAQCSSKQTTDREQALIWPEAG